MSLVNVRTKTRRHLNVILRYSPVLIQRLIIAAIWQNFIAIEKLCKIAIMWLYEVDYTNASKKMRQKHCFLIIHTWWVVFGFNVLQLSHWILWMESFFARAQSHGTQIRVIHDTTRRRHWNLMRAVFPFNITALFFMNIAVKWKRPHMRPNLALKINATTLNETIY